MQIDKRGIIIIGIAFLLFVAGTHYYINKMEMEGADTRVIWPDQGEKAEEVGSGEQWTHTCSNSLGGYEVKYPSEWTIKKGDAIQGIEIVKDCSSLKFKEKETNRLDFSSLNQNEALSLSAGISISVTPNVEWRTFENIYRETKVDGEKMIWTDRNYGEFYHENSRYEVNIFDDTNEKTVIDFLSTFKFLK